MTINIIYFIIIFILFIISVELLILIIKNNKSISNFKELKLDECLYILAVSIAQTKDEIRPKLNQITKKYSGANSVQQIIKEQDALITSSAIDIIKSLGDDLNRTLLQYYNSNGLFKYIFTELKKLD